MSDVNARVVLYLRKHLLSSSDMMAILNVIPSKETELLREAAREIERRARRVMSGDSAGEPWDDVRSVAGRRVKRNPSRLRAFVVAFA